MAHPKKKRKPRTTVPVVSRAKAQGQDNLLAPEHDSSIKGKLGGLANQPGRLSVAGYGILAVFVIFFLLTVYVPLNNFYDGRTEIARLNESIAAKQAEKQRLLAEIDRYRSDSYIEQEARRRLGLVTPGETAYRILDPKMSHDPGVTTDKALQKDSRKWYTVLWDSVSEPPTEALQAPPAPEEAPAQEPAPAAPDQPVPGQSAPEEPVLPAPGEPAPPAPPVVPVLPAPEN